MDAAVEQFGRLDVVVHAAQVMAYGRIEDVPREVYEQVVDVAVHGTATVARVVLPLFRKQGAGHLVVVNSLLGNIAAPLMGSYVAAKWGQLGLVRVLQQETRDEPGISVSAVQPGGVDTPIYFQARDLDRQHRPPAAAGVLAAAGRAARCCPPWTGRAGIVQAGLFNPLITAGFRLAPGRLRRPGRAAAAADGDRERRGAADRGQRLRVASPRATPPRGAGAASRPASRS